MDQNRRDQYRSFCSLYEPQLPLFLMDWWLDACCGKAGWDAAIVERKGEVRGVMPFAVQKKFGLSFSKIPLLTPFLGPWLIYPQDQKFVSRMSDETELLTELIAQLPRCTVFRQKFHYYATNWLPFYWKGFDQTTRYSYVLDIRNMEEVFASFKSSVRGKIRKAQEVVTVTDQQSIEAFYSLLKMTFSRQGHQMPVSAGYLKKIDESLALRNQRKIFFAMDSNGKLHSSLYLSWDKHSAYVHMVGEDPTLRSSGAGSLLVWEAIQFASTHLRLGTFDFLGSMIESIETVRRSFGARQVPFHQIEKIPSPLLRALFAWKGSKLT